MALALIPALAALATIVLHKFGIVAIDSTTLNPHQRHELLILTMLYNGFFLTSLIGRRTGAFDRPALQSSSPIFCHCRRERHVLESFTHLWKVVRSLTLGFETSLAQRGVSMDSCLCV